MVENCWLGNLSAIPAHCLFSWFDGDRTGLELIPIVRCDDSDLFRLSTARQALIMRLLRMEVSLEVQVSLRAEMPATVAPSLIPRTMWTDLPARKARSAAVLPGPEPKL